MCALMVTDDTDNFGNTYPESYHRVLTANADWTARRAVIVMGAYKDEDARNADKAPYNTFPITIQGDAFEQSLGENALDRNVRRNVYQQIKQLTIYQDAEDV